MTDPCATRDRTRSPALEMVAVTKVYGRGPTEVRALTDVSLTVGRGELVAVMGPSGCGKSTLLHLAGGLEDPTAGAIRVDGLDVPAMTAAERASLRRTEVGYVFQRLNLVPSLTALENVMLPIELKNDRDARHKAQQLLERVGLGERGHHYPNQLSGGEQQRVAIARAFASQAQILFADEPTGNLDSATGARVIDLLFALNQEYATTLVLVTHDDRLARKCHRTVRLVAGEVVSDDINEEVAA